MADITLQELARRVDELERGQTRPVCRAPRTYPMLTAANKLVVGKTAFVADKATGQVGIGTATPTTSALLDLTSTTGAMLLPRMTTVQRDALTAANGMVIYNTTTKAVEGYEDGSWVNL